jgi:predicted ArsR family transcriptional regulator
MSTDQLSFDDPPAQRHSRTSREAARAIKDHAPSLRDRVLGCIERCGPITDQAGAVTLGMSENTWRPRRVELVAEGLVRADAETQHTLSGREAVAWVACEPL